MCDASKEIILHSDEENTRIDSWLSLKLNKYSRSFIKKLISKKLVLVNGLDIKSNYKLKLDDVIIITVPAPKKLEVKPEDVDLNIVYEDNDIIVINKPRGMVVHPAAGNYSGTLVNALMGYCGDRLSDINGVIRPGIVHRIDKDTSGLLVVAKNNYAHETLSEKLKHHDINRIYVAIVHGIIRENCGKIDAPIGRHPVDRKKMSVNTKSGRNAITHFKVLSRFSNATYLELRLETGRTHQIRVHMSYIGHPIIGDPVYGRNRNNFGIEGQALHAAKLIFEHPVTKENVEFIAEPPSEFKNLLSML